MRRVLIGLIAILALVACESMPPGAGSPGVDSAATATGLQGAQNIGGDQGLGQTPQDTVGGLATQNWWFASQGDSKVQMEVIGYAREVGATMVELKDALTALSGAPQTVSITAGDTAIAGGDAEAVGATTGAGTGNNIAPDPKKP